MSNVIPTSVGDPKAQQRFINSHKAFLQEFPALQSCFGIRTPISISSSASKLTLVAARSQGYGLKPEEAGTLPVAALSIVAGNPNGGGRKGFARANAKHRWGRARWAEEVQLRPVKHCLQKSPVPRGKDRQYLKRYTRLVRCFGRAVLLRLLESGSRGRSIYRTRLGRECFLTGNLWESKISQSCQAVSIREMSRNY
jgi:hypothetical protein